MPKCTDECRTANADRRHIFLFLMLCASMWKLHASISWDEVCIGYHLYAQYHLLKYCPDFCVSTWSLLWSLLPTSRASGIKCLGRYEGMRRSSATPRSTLRRFNLDSVWNTVTSKTARKKKLFSLFRTSSTILFGMTIFGKCKWSVSILDQLTYRLDAYYSVYSIKVMVPGVLE